MTHPRILMCPPDHYGIEYEINAWMSRQRQADHAQAVRQWESLKDKLETSGATIELMQPAQGLPDMVFTANAGLVHRQEVILSRFKPPQRRGEEEHDKKWFDEHGFRVTLLPEDVFFEGAGDALFCGETLVAGYRQRSDAEGSSCLASYWVAKLFRSNWWIHTIITSTLVSALSHQVWRCTFPEPSTITVVEPSGIWSPR